jgi:uncharacterized protein (DUF58 family)
MRSGAPTFTLRGRLRAWALRRQGPDALPLKLASRRIYILPTPAGWTFALLLGVMFVAGMNYGNGLALLFTFWLGGFALVAMVQTQRGLEGTRVLAAVATPAHAGGTVSLRIDIAGRTAPQDLRLQLDEVQFQLPQAASVTERAQDEDTDEGSISIEIPVSRRGRWRAPALHLSSSAPFGLFRSWTWLALDVETIVYPRPAGPRPVPETSGEERGSLQQAHGLDELAWLRDFREGDSPRQVAWKAYARGQPLLVREYHGEGALRHEFDFDLLPGLTVEARLSQLTRWIIEAQARGEHWVLRMPGSPALEGGGLDHLTLCLTRLALHG